MNNLLELGLSGVSVNITLAFLGFYIILQIISDIYRVMTTQRGNVIPEITKLIGEYNVNIRTFHKDSNHNGFAWFGTIYLNDMLLNRIRNKRAKKGKIKYPSLYFAFYHELYHVRKHHKRNILLHRFAFSFTPLLLNIPAVINISFGHSINWSIDFSWAIFIGSLFLYAYFMYYLKEKVYEANANKYADKMMKS